MMKKRKISVIVMLLLFLTLLNIGGYVKPVNADTQYWVYADNDNYDIMHGRGML